MKFLQTSIPGVFEIQTQPVTDERGFFARTWCREEFQSHGLSAELAQCSLSYNAKKGTLRGLHFQAAPYREAKLVRCTQGAIFDVALDLRADSPAFKRWTAATLSAADRNMFYIPEGCAHGFLTLEDSTEVFYQISQVYDAGSARGVRWNDPAFGIEWPAGVEVISQRDRGYPDFR